MNEEVKLKDCYDYLLMKKVKLDNRINKIKKKINSENMRNEFFLKFLEDKHIKYCEMKETYRKVLKDNKNLEKEIKIEKLKPLGKNIVKNNLNCCIFKFSDQIRATSNISFSFNKSEGISYQKN